MIKFPYREEGYMRTTTRSGGIGAKGPPPSFQTLLAGNSAGGREFFWPVASDTTESRLSRAT